MVMGQSGEMACPGNIISHQPELAPHAGMGEFPEVGHGDASRLPVPGHDASA